ncbi:hypothetical protein EG327_001297 [Venturia inaequalis]|uniref:Helicase ATP-binding domain-containing protein n=1 Tax=Venturia inaequalis TaxID=5025 RepID=A0A8H3ZBV3_VENIN|nr:hypothetical protein EG327_001297 [Venturia inaequalis]
MSREKHGLSPTSAKASDNNVKRPKPNEAGVEQDPDLPQGAKDLNATVPFSPVVAEAEPDVFPNSKLVFKPKGTVTPPLRGNSLNLSSAPFSDIHDMFLDIIKKASLENLHEGVTDDRSGHEHKPGEPPHSGALDAMLQHFGGRSLQVATMCSGSESPILALRLIQQSLTQAGKTPFEFDHVLSAENDPFKQAYIQRNFSPPLLFQDVTKFNISLDKESGKDVLTGLTAFGSLRSLPRDVDILITGCSCKDLSNLNPNKAKNVEEREGSSKHTFDAVCRYAMHNTPRIVLFENTQSNDGNWDIMENRMSQIGYASKFVILDTKNFYIPQTRRRRYMLSLRKDLYAEDVYSMLDLWAKILTKLQHRASAPITQFLLPANDPRILTLAALDSNTKRKGFKQDAKWEGSRERHMDERAKWATGPGRPFSSLLPEHCQHKFLKSKVDRELELLDIRYLRAASTKDWDLSFKTCVINISQNVDRVDSSPLGVTGCLTPSGSFYLTDAARPLNGYEALILQGIPVDEVSFTTESNNQLHDLAGNAMTSTVVGSAVLAALLVGFRMLAPSFGGSKVSIKSKTVSTLQVDPGMLLESASDKIILDTNYRLLFEEAQETAQKCFCEGAMFVSKHKIFSCEDCGQTICGQCKGSPIHSYHSNSTSSTSRPEEFVNKWSPKFPLRVQFSDGTSPPPEQYKAFSEIFKRGMSGLTTEEWTNLLVKQTFVFDRFRRQTSWTISYRSSTARLELVLSERPEWRLFLQLPKDLASDSLLRTKLRNHYVARARVNPNGSLCIPGSDLEWEFLIPFKPVNLTMTGSHLVKSWRAEIGLENFVEERVPSQLDVQLQPTTESTTMPINMIQTVTGSYTLLPKCGTAFRSLYKRDNGNSQIGHDVFLFLDPDPVGDESKDRFVVSHDCRRIGSARDQRDVIASLDKWRPWKGVATDPISTEFAGVWQEGGNLRLEIADFKVEYRYLPPDQCQQALSLHGCTAVPSLLTASFNPRDFESHDLSTARWAQRNIQPEDKAFFEMFSSIFRGAQGLHRLSEWMDATDFIKTDECSTCSPPAPKAQWGRNSESLMTIRDDPLHASNYERLMMSRPDALTIRLGKADPPNQVVISVGLNVKRLAHEAVVHLRRINPNSKPSTRWCLQTGVIQPVAFSLPKFHHVLTGNNECDPHRPVADMNTKCELREDQLKSLTWMKEQERGQGKSFTLAHSEEAILPFVGWRLEVQAYGSVRIKGGVLADAPSYGKTVTAIALVQEEWHRQKSQDRIIGEFEKTQSGLIKTAATMIVTPGHLLQQWAEEIIRFLPKLEVEPGAVVKIRNINDLNKTSVQSLLDAKIVLVSFDLMATNGAYIKRLAHLTALNLWEGPDSGRASRYWLDLALDQLVASVESLRSSGSTSNFVEWLRKQQIANDHKFSKVDVEEIAATAQPDLDVGPDEATNLNPDIDGWKAFACPVLHMFHWNRLVIDEFALTSSKLPLLYSCLVKLDAEKRWILSGTPPLDDFHDVNLIARLIGIDLGVDSFQPGIISNEKVRSSRDQLSKVQEFQSFQEKSSVSSTKLDDLIVFREKQATTLEDAVRKALEGVSELSEQWRIRQEEKQKPKETKAGRENREKEEQQENEEQGAKPRKPRKPRKPPTKPSVPRKAAIPKQPVDSRSVYERWEQDKHNDPETKLTLVRLVAEVAEERRIAEEALAKQLREAEQLKEVEKAKKESKKEGENGDEQEGENEYEKEELQKNERSNKKKGNGKHSEKNEKKSVKKGGERSAPIGKNEEMVDEGVGNTVGKSDKPDNPEDDGDVEDGTAEDSQADKYLKTKVQELRALTREMEARNRSLRYIRAIKQFLADPAAAKGDIVFRCEGIQCPRRGENIPSTQVRVLSSCGHIICGVCLPDIDVQSHVCVVDGCKANFEKHQQQGIGDLGTDEGEKGFGRKLGQIVEQLNHIVDEQAILFTQDDYLAGEAKRCFEAYGIEHTALLSFIEKEDKTQSSAQRIDSGLQVATKVNEFKKKNSKFKVLIISLDSEHVTGLNLTNANHVFFLSPYHATDQFDYDAKMLQSIRRCYRTGQKKDVTIYRYVALDTIDVYILQNRERTLVKPLWEKKVELDEKPDIFDYAMSTEQPRGVLKGEESKLVKYGDRFVLAHMDWIEKRRGDIDVSKDYSSKVEKTSFYEHFDDQFEIENLLEGLEDLPDTSKEEAGGNE